MSPSEPSSATVVDVLIVGAGISGIGAAYRLQTMCPDKTFAIVEARDAIGGTWDLFRYPGIRSDSDMSTLGYPFRPWKGDKQIADGPSILAYVRDTAKEFGIDRKIQFHHRVERASWSSDAKRWTVEVRRSDTDELVRFECRFLFACSGYYDYAAGFTPEFPGLAKYRGKVVHPQKWPEDLDYEGKRVVVIGSGATAITLVPAMSKKARLVTMLQRSPTYVVSMPAVDVVGKVLGAALPRDLGYDVTRLKNVALASAMYEFCRKYPERAKKVILGAVRRELGESCDVETHFTPRYDPWDQRLCIVPNGDLFKAIREKQVEVVTDRIASFTETGITLESGRTIEADIVVTATGLSVQLLGGATLEVDGARVALHERTTYKGAMLSGVPNMALAIGYTNASWTLKSDLTARYVCRLLNEMDKRRYRIVTPQVSEGDIGDAPVLDLASGYVQRAAAKLPRQGTRAPWKVYQNYFVDFLGLELGKLVDGTLRFS